MKIKTGNEQKRDFKQSNKEHYKLRKLRKLRRDKWQAKEAA